jgi:predicted 2-oxoglutarate/Fe(II)-dependent dioxygenase YbiX/peroxiredoxin
MAEARKFLFGPGEAVPWFRAAALNGSPAYAFDIAGGRVVLLLFFGSAAEPASADALARVMALRALFDDRQAAFFGITVDPRDAAEGRIRQQLPGLRFFLDYQRQLSAAFGAALDDGGYRPHWLLLDRTLRVAGCFALDEGEAALAAAAALAIAPPAQDWAPVIAVPDVLEPELCRRLIHAYEADGGEESGFMQDEGGKTRLIVDPSHKIRRDFLIEEPSFARQLNLRLVHRLLPMVSRAFSFTATRVERLLVGCYEAETGGHFRAHRDNTTKGTAHRRFAVTINLNAEDYEGGDLCFPEFGPRTYRAATGGAIVFSCSLLHQAMPVTKGRRFAFLPFLYDEETALLRERNAVFLEGEGANYRADQDVKVC